MMQIQMVDLKTQYQKIKEQVDAAVLNCLASTQYINGPEVQSFSSNLANFLGVGHVIPCANGTDALQIAMMALDLKPGDEVIVPAFTYVSTAEVIGLLGLTPIMIDVEADTFNVSASLIETAITPKTKAIVPVHLFGQSADMESIMALAKKHNLWVIEDNAQGIGADYTFSDGTVKKTGTIGHIGCTSFYPSKNLGCYGDGGAICTNDSELAHKLKMVANHGQQKRYYHDEIGVNSRLDAIQAAILNVKLPLLNEYSTARAMAAKYYDEALQGVTGVILPKRAGYSTHVFHQYTLQVLNGKRDELQSFLTEKGIPSMIYYPVPLYKQGAFEKYVEKGFSLENTEFLCDSVLSLPMHTELTEEQLSFITRTLKSFFN